MSDAAARRAAAEEAATLSAPHVCENDTPNSSNLAAFYSAVLSSSAASYQHLPVYSTALPSTVAVNVPQQWLLSEHLEVAEQAPLRAPAAPSLAFFQAAVRVALVALTVSL